MFSLFNFKIERLLATLLISLLMIACQVAGEDDQQQAVKTEPGTNNIYLTLVNTIRKEGCKCGSTYYAPVAALIWNTQLEKAALKHSQDMADRNYFSHTSKNGKNTGDRIEAEGYEWSAYGENIFMAEGYEPDEKEVVENWKKSPAHCKNMMNKDFKEMGVARYKTRWTQVFATKL